MYSLIPPKHPASDPSPHQFLPDLIETLKILRTRVSKEDFGEVNNSMLSHFGIRIKKIITQLIMY